LIRVLVSECDDFDHCGVKCMTWCHRWRH